MVMISSISLCPDTSRSVVWRQKIVIVVLMQMYSCYKSTRRKGPFCSRSLCGKSFVDSTLMFSCGSMCVCVYMWACPHASAVCFELKDKARLYVNTPAVSIPIRWGWRSQGHIISKWEKQKQSRRFTGLYEVSYDDRWKGAGWQSIPP